MFDDRPSRPMSPIPNFEDGLSMGDSNLTELKLEESLRENAQTSDEVIEDSQMFSADNKTTEKMEGKNIDVMNGTANRNNGQREMVELSGRDFDEIYQQDETKSSAFHRVQSTNSLTVGLPEGDNLPRDTSSDALCETRLSNSITLIANVDPQLCGLPLTIFTTVTTGTNTLIKKAKIVLILIKSLVLGIPLFTVFIITVFRSVGGCKCQRLHCGSNKCIVQTEETTHRRADRGE